MATNIPPAPLLSGYSVLEVFTHHSAPAQDGARLRFLGQRQLKLAYTSALMAKRPNLNGDQLTPYMDINYPVFIAHWVNAYGWRARVRAPYGVNLNDPEETRIIFETYAGAVVDDYRHTDPDKLLNWIRELVNISG